MSEPSAITHTILVVDDEPDLREGLEELLLSEGYNVVTAADGVEALARVRDTPRPCVILLDLMMPRMSGWEFLDIHRSDPLLAAIPVVVVSAVVDPPRARAAGAVAVIQKPFEFTEILKQVGLRCHLDRG